MDRYSALALVRAGPSGQARWMRAWRDLEPRPHFLERVCATSVAPLAVGRGRYAFMLREDGLVMDDGTARDLPEGHVTSSGRRLTGDGAAAVALALLRGGAARTGETLTARSPTRGRAVRVEVVAPHFHDPVGARYRD